MIASPTLAAQQYQCSSGFAHAQTARQACLYGRYIVLPLTREARSLTNNIPQRKTVVKTSFLDAPSLSYGKAARLVGQNRAQNNPQ
eukprot:XP_001692292.1 predicted protein [Chlamydomonas reinhardtii]